MDLALCKGDDAKIAADRIARVLNRIGLRNVNGETVTNLRERLRAGAGKGVNELQLKAFDIRTYSFLNEKSLEEQIDLLMNELSSFNL